MSRSNGQFLLSLATVGVLAMACGRISTCSRGDMSAYMDPVLRDALAGEEWAWMRDAKVCKVGQYQIIAPAAGEDETIFVLRGKEGVFARASGSAMLFKSGLPVALLREGESPTAPSALSYDLRDDSSGLWITVIDRDLDGQSDMRTRYVKGQDRTIEIWHEDRWRTMVRRDGQSGFIRDGQFVPLASSGTQPRVEAK